MVGHIRVSSRTVSLPFSHAVHPVPRKAIWIDCKQTSAAKNWNFRGLTCGNGLFWKDCWKCLLHLLRCLLTGGRHRLPTRARQTAIRTEGPMYLVMLLLQLDQTIIHKVRCSQCFVMFEMRCYGRRWFVTDALYHACQFVSSLCRKH